MGWDPRELGRPQFLMLSTQGGMRARRRHARSRSATTPGTGRSGCSMQAAAEELAALRRPSVRRLLHRSRATAARRARPACSTACLSQRRGDRFAPADPLAAHAPGVMGVATCDKGLPAMMMALAGTARLALRARARRRDAAAHRGRRRGQGPDDRRPLRARRTHAGEAADARAAGPAARRGRLPVPRHGGHVAGRRPRRSGLRCRTPRSRPPASQSGSTWLALGRARC